MKKLFLIGITLFLFFISIAYKEAFSWEPTTTHWNMSLYAAESSVLSKDKGDYLRNLGFENGIGEYLKWGNYEKEIKYWIAEGVNLEDERTSVLPTYGTMRSVNHFHNPLEQSPWTNAGLDDWVLLLHYTGRSSLLWAQDGANQEDYVGGDWSWKKVREKYYYALIAVTDEDRRMNFAQTFRGLGHQMHLIQDAAQPDHVRNDAHPEDSLGLTYGTGFEKWAGEEFSNLDRLKAFAPTPAQPDVALNVSYNNLVPITQFLDTDQYNGTNPTTGLAQGIAEYTNANFFSDDTIFSAERYSTGHRHYFPYPNRGSTDLQSYIDGTKPPETVTARDGTTDTGIWISKTADGESIGHFLRPSFWTPIIYQIVGEGNLYYKTFYRDNICHEDYAALLIPRAVGYSAGLLNYFFRGELQIIRAGPDTFRIENLTEEDMQGSLDSFRLFYDDINNNRKEIPLEFYDQTGARYTAPDTILSIPALSISAFTAKLAGTPVEPRSPGEYLLVFKGKLGNEGTAPYDTDYAIAARIFKGRTNIIQTGTDTFQIVNLSEEDMQGNLDSYRLYYKDTNGNEQEIPLAFYDQTGTRYTAPDTVLTIPAQTKSLFTAELTTSPVEPRSPGEYLLVFKGKLGSKGTAPYDTDYATINQEITPHFLSHAEINGQKDIYEYDLNGNRIYSLTGGLPRGEAYYSGIPNPVDPDIILYQTNSGCAEAQSCLHLLSKTTEQEENLQKSGVFWWSNDGTKIHALRSGYYDMQTGTWTASPWIITEACLYSGFSYPPSSSNDETKTAIQALDPYGTEYDHDILIYTNSILSHIIDMKTTGSLIALNQPTDCTAYGGDENYIDAAPDYHPTEDKILYSTNAGGTYDQNYAETIPHEIYLADISSGSIQKLTDTPAGDRGYYQGAWSPDGQSILMVGEQQGKAPEIYIMPAGGGDPEKITNENIKHYYPRWIRYLGQ